MNGREMRQRGGAFVRRRALQTVVVAVAMIVLAGCTSDDPDDPAADTEVAGNVLERDQDGRPAPAEDPDDTDPHPAAAADADEPVTDHLDEPEPVEVDGADVADPPAPAGDDQATADPSSRPAPTSPAPTPAPQPPTAPRPRVLAAGLASPGIALGFGDDDTETSSVTLERDQPPLVSDAVRIGDDDRVACATRLHAPDDRALTAKGTLRVGLVIDERDGSVRRVPRQLVELDVHVVSGAVHELPLSRAYAFDRATLWGIACEAVFQPG